MLRWSVATRG